jgi:hypothetical protein
VLIVRLGPKTNLKTAIIYEVFLQNITIYINICICKCVIGSATKLRLLLIVSGGKPPEPPSFCTASSFVSGFRIFPSKFYWGYSRQVCKRCNVRMVTYFVKFVKGAELNSKPTNHQAYISYKSYTSLGHVLSL